MLYQLHWQWIKNGKTDFRSQREINSTEEMKAFVKEMNKEQPPPESAIWLVCNEKSEYFVGVKI